MSSLSSLYIKKETLKTLLDTVGKKGEKGIELTISIQDETNTYGQNLSAFVSQSKEDRDAKKPKYYVGNGKNFWNDGNITVAEKVDSDSAPQSNDDREEDNPLPF